MWYIIEDFGYLRSVFRPLQQLAWHMLSWMCDLNTEGLGKW